MAWTSFWIIFAICAISIFIFRVLPMLAFAGKELPPKLMAALDFVPVAAFAALVANDLCQPEAFATGPWPSLLPLVAAIPVVFVAIKTKNLALCIVVGVVAYGLLMLIPV